MHADSPRICTPWPDYADERQPVDGPADRGGRRRLSGGGEYLLGSGLMEITYNTGVKVVLEGGRDISSISHSGMLLAAKKKVTVKTNAKANDGKRNCHPYPTTASPRGGAEFGVWVSQSR